MTVDQHIQIWNAVGTWFAGLATFAAVVVSLYLASRSERVRLEVYVGLRMVSLGDGSPPEEHVCFGITNLGNRPVTISKIGWAVGRRKNRRFWLQTVSGRWTAQYPIDLPHGKSTSLMVSFAQTPQWVTEFAKGFVQDLSDRNLKTLVAQVHTSVGKTIEVKPEPDLLLRLKKVTAGG